MAVDIIFMYSCINLRTTQTENETNENNGDKTEEKKQQYNNNEQVTCSMMEDIDWQQSRSQFTVFVFYSMCAGYFFFLLPFSVCLRFPCNRSTERIKLKSKGATQKNHLIKYEEKKKKATK